IELLEKRVAELEAEKSKGLPAAQHVEEASTIRPGQRVEQVPAQLPQSPPSTPQAMHPEAPLQVPVPEGPFLKIAGFSDFNFTGSDQKGTKSGFNEGQFVLHLNSNLSPKVSFMGEVSLTARTDAGTGTPPATGFNAEVERSIIRFEHNDYLKVSFG